MQLAEERKKKALTASQVSPTRFFVRRPAPKRANPEKRWKRDPKDKKTTSAEKLGARATTGLEPRRKTEKKKRAQKVPKDGPGASQPKDEKKTKSDFS